MSARKRTDIKERVSMRVFSDPGCAMKCMNVRVVGFDEFETWYFA